MKVFLGIAAVMAWIFGAGLLFAPGPFHEPMGITLTPILATVAQAHGATLIGLGVLNWLARAAEGKGLLAVLTGNLVVQLLSLGVAIRITTLGAPAIPALIIHTVLGGFFAYFLVRARRLPSVAKAQGAAA